MLDELCAGICAIHDDNERATFLKNLWHRREELRRFIEADSLLSTLFDSRRLPTFLLGGSSAGKVVVMGVNPGADDQTAEEVYKQQSAEHFVQFHEEFMTQFPKVRRNGKQVYWTKLCRVVSALEGTPLRDTNWAWLSNHVSGQDLIPLSSKSDAISMDMIRGSSPVRRLAEATVQGLLASKARLILAFTPKAFALLTGVVRNRRDFELRGMTSKGGKVTVLGFHAELGTIPVLCVSNALLSQPRFAYHQMIPQLREQLGQQRIPPVPADSRSACVTLWRTPIAIGSPPPVIHPGETVVQAHMVVAVDALVSPNEPVARLGDVYAWFESLGLDWGATETRFGRYFELAEGSARQDGILEKWKRRGHRETGWSSSDDRDSAAHARAVEWASRNGWRRVRYAYECACGFAEQTSYAPRRRKLCPRCGKMVARRDVDP